LPDSPRCGASFWVHFHFLYVPSTRRRGLTGRLTVILGFSPFSSCLLRGRFLCSVAWGSPFFHPPQTQKKTPHSHSIRKALLSFAPPPLVGGGAFFLFSVLHFDSFFFCLSKLPFTSLWESSPKSFLRRPPPGGYGGFLIKTFFFPQLH